MADGTKRFVVRAQLGGGSLWRPTDCGGEQVSPSELNLSDRLVVAIADWTDFYQEIAGDLSDPAVSEEFVSQGFKIAHRIRAEIKGSEVHLVHPTTGEEVSIERKTAR